MMTKDLKFALIFEGLFSYDGESRVNEQFVKIFPNADIYALYGTQEFSDKYFNGKKVNFSFLNRFPFIKKLYTYYLPFWSIAIESFDLSNYDLVISSSHAVAKGCITSQDTIHISYIHTPMRFLWDLKDIYSKYGLLKAPNLNYLRSWDVVSSNRPDKLISNSQFISDRCKRYWGREADKVIYPPVNLYSGKLISYKDREGHFVIGAPFAENKGGRMAIDLAKKYGFNLKIIGKSRKFKELKRYAKGVNNIQFLGRISEEEKWNILSHASGLLAMGIEDFGIFPIEAISCATPVLAINKGGYRETVVDGVNGVLFENEKDFKNKLDEFVN
ncbi:MAG: glycosyltransferase, partial [Candidatus Dojkabacteria bacterium]|nr:glycosyltransferase [Candidatus Dojkabacteria bacterium]